MWLAGEAPAARAHFGRRRRGVSTGGDVRIITGVATFAALVASSVHAQSTAEVFAGRPYSLVLPAGFVLAGRASPSPAVTTIGFASPPRPDGTRTLVQVSLFDLQAVSPDAAPTLEAFAASMIGAVRVRRGDWSQTDGTVQVSGVQAVRIAWRGSSGPSPERPTTTAPAMMRGIMLIGIKDGIGFALHTQDLERYADSTLVVTERALLTFAIMPRTAPPP